MMMRAFGKSPVSSQTFFLAAWMSAIGVALVASSHSLVSAVVSVEPVAEPSA